MIKCLIAVSAMLGIAMAHAATPQISVGWKNQLILRADGTVWGSGEVKFDDYGMAVPVRVSEFTDVIQVEAGVKAVYLIRADHSLWAAGENNYTALGNGSKTRTSTFVKLLDNVKQISSASWSTLAVDIDGFVWGWGRNSEGQLGLGDRIDRSVPTKIPNLRNVVQIETSGNNGFALKSDGTVWSWGSNCCGQLGNGLMPQNVSDPNWISTTPSQMPELSDIVQVSKRGGVGLALKRDGTVWVWGTGFHGELGDGEPPKNIGTAKQISSLSGIKQVLSGGDALFAVKSDGSVYGWGSPTGGELGPANTGVQSLPVKLNFVSGVQALDAAGGSVVALLSGGSLAAWGDNINGQLGTADIGLKQPLAFVKGPGGVGDMNVNGTGNGFVNQLPTFELTVTTSGTKAPVTATATLNNLNDTDGRVVSAKLFTSDGQTISANEGKFSFSDVGSYTVYALVKDDSGGARIARNWPELIALPGDVAISTTPQLVARFDQPTTLSSNGAVHNWGMSWATGINRWSNDGPPPDAITTPYQLFNGAIAIAGGANTRFAVMANGQVLGWGINSDGQLGKIPRDNVLVQTIAGLSRIRQFAAGWGHGLALDLDGAVWVSGRNDFGQLGLGDNTASDSYQRLNGLPVIKQIATTEWTSYALDIAGNVWAWGRGDAGQIGDGSQRDALVPKKIAGLSGIGQLIAGSNGILVTDNSGGAWGWGDVAFYPIDASWPFLIPAKAQGLADFTKMACYHNCAAIDKAGAIWTWGNPAITELGDGSVEYRSLPQKLSNVNNAVDVAVGHNFMMARLSDGTVLSWGENIDGKLGNGTLARQIFPQYVVSQTGEDLLDLDGGRNQINPVFLPLFFLQTNVASGNLAAKLTDSRATGFDASVYFTALVPADSPLIKTSNNFAADPPPSVVPVALGRGGVKQTGPSLPAPVAYTGALNSGNQFSAYSGLPSDPLKGSNALICMGITLPALSAKGQVLMRPIANGDKSTGTSQCPTVQTEATTLLYSGAISGTSTSRTIVAKITPQPEDLGQVRNVYSWAVAPNGQQFMQTGPNQWEPMREPMLPAMAVTVPKDGSPISLPVTQNLDLSTLAGTLVYVGMGSSWVEVKQLNKAGHYYTVQ